MQLRFIINLEEEEIRLQKNTEENIKVLEIEENSNDKKNKIISIIIALFAMFTLNLQFDKASNWLGYIAKDCFSLFVFMLIIAIYFLINCSLKIKNKRLTICSWILGMIFAITYFCGYLGETYMNTTIPISKKFLLYAILKISCYYIIFSSAIKIIIFNLEKLKKKNLLVQEKEYRFFTNNKKSLFLIALMFLISYVPYILYYYPGTIFYDNMQSLLQITGKANYNNFQPILYTLIYGGLWNLGKTVFNSGNAGILLYTIFQAIFASFTFSIVLYYMAKRKIALKWRIFTLAILLLNPITGMFVVRGEKGLLFHLSIILVILGIIDIIFEKNEFFEKKWKLIIFVIITLFMVFIRNNGIYTFLLTVPFIIISFYKNKKLLLKATITLITPIIIFYIIQGPIFKLCGTEGSSIKEMLSIPAQQIARIIKYEGENISKENLETINKYIDTDNGKIGEKYKPELADNTKAKIKVDQLEKDKIGFIKLYIKLAIEYPVHTFSALINNTFAYYAPNATYMGGLSNYNEETKDVLTRWYASENPGQITNYEEYDYHPKHIIDLPIFDKLNTEFSWKRIPIFSVLFTGIGMYFWILLFLAMYFIYKKEYKKICMLLPMFILWLTNIAGPVVDIRYIYSIILIIPLYIGVTFFVTKNKDR